MSESPQLHHRTCHLCEAMCGITIELENDQIRAIRGDRDDPFSKGHLCPKAVALQDLHNDPDRLRKPLRRRGSSWEEIGWDEALDTAAAGLLRIQERHGNDAVAMYLGNPMVHNYSALLYAQDFLRSLKTRNRFSATSVDQLPHHFAAYFLFGHQLMLPVPDLDRCHTLLILGANPLASNGSLMTAPGVKSRLEAIRARGGSVILIDPRRTETAAVCDRHLFIQPGSDALLLAAMVTTLFEEDRVRPGRLAGFIDGMAHLREALAHFTPEAVAGATRIPAAEIRGLARTLSDSSAAACYGRMGLSTQPFGATCQWLLLVLNILTGNLDREGGMMFSRPAADVVAGIAGVQVKGSHDRWRSRVRQLPEFGGELPVSTLADEILTEGKGQVKALVTAAGNPVLSTPDGRRLDTALESLELMISVDLYRNETTRHAHLILPPVSPLERDHFDLVFNLLAVRNVARYSPPLFEPPPHARHDWQIWAALEARMQRGRLRERMLRGVRHRLGPRRILDLALRTGPWGAGFRPGGRGLSLARLEAEPHGIDLGPLQPCLPDRLYTPNARIDLAPDIFRSDLPRLTRWLEQDQQDSLVLIGRRHLSSNNSWMHNSERLNRSHNRCTLLVHPEDATRLGLRDGATASVQSRVGRLEAQVEIRDTVMPGVVSLPHGWGHDRSGSQLQVAARTPGVSLNDLTDSQRIDTLSGNSALNGIRVVLQPL